MSGSVDLSKCPNIRRCKCGPKCTVCGYGKHVGAHGPHFGEQPGGVPYGHEYQPDDYTPGLEAEVHSRW